MRRRSSTILAVLPMLLVPFANGSAAELAITNTPVVPSPTAIEAQVVAEGLKNPWGLAFLPDGRLIVSERVGTLRIVTQDGKIGPPIAGVPEVVARGQGGLLDVALAPNFVSSGTLYLGFSEARPGGGNGTSVAKAKLVLDGDSGRLDGLSVIFRQEPAMESTLHFGTRIVFAANGDLMFGLGDRGIARDEAQNPANHLGKVIRIKPDGQPSDLNPKRDGWDAKVWSIGHRNIQGAAIDPATDQIWTVEHGARGGDELNKPEAGKNYGWPIITYGVEYSGLPIGDGLTAKDGLEQPVYFWKPSIATSGLALYSGDLISGWKGNLLVGGLRGAHLQRLVLENGRVIGHERLLEDLDERIRDVRQAPDGSVWVATDDANGKLIRLRPKT
ncbi:MAG: PQQ-dependent sugar dehydrogenase [Hyphomicrobium sp.]|nr:PQQ-dependent sugar dehydrogenase [Hyphomicrobium sp.]